MDLVERQVTTEDPLTAATTSSNHETKSQPATDDVSTSNLPTTPATGAPHEEQPNHTPTPTPTTTTNTTTTTTTTTNNSNSNSNTSKHLSITEVTFSMTVASTSTKTDNKGKMFTVYNIKVSALGTRWVVPKRFSELELLHDALQKSYPQCRLPKFPSKGGLGGLFRRLDDSTIEKRRYDLQQWFEGALLHSMIYKSQLLRLFFELPRGIVQASREADDRAAVRAARGNEGRAQSFEDVDPTDGGGSNNTTGTSNSGTNRHPDHFNIDSIAVNKQINFSNTTAPKSIVLFSNQSVQPELSYDHQGLRLAIKNGNIEEVQSILTVDSKLARYVDSVSRQSMLHLACIFSHTEVAMLLLSEGADPELKNSHGESSFDLAPPALAQKMKLYIEEWEKEHIFKNDT